MKIKEILELTFTKSSAEIAKEYLTFGEKRLREALKEIGCTNQPGKRGWQYTGEDKELLERSIYDFVKANKSKSIANAKQNASKEIAVAIEKEVSTSKVTANQKKTASELDSIDILLLQNELESEQRVYRGFYWDKDIIHFLDNVKHGNKSDLMNEIVRTVLKNKGLIE